MVGTGQYGDCKTPALTSVKILGVLFSRHLVHSNGCILACSAIDFVQHSLINYDTPTASMR